MLKNKNKNIPTNDNTHGSAVDTCYYFYLKIILKILPIGSQRSSFCYRGKRS
jgi:hypothetical protein